LLFKGTGDPIANMKAMTKVTFLAYVGKSNLGLTSKCL